MNKQTKHVTLRSSEFSFLGGFKKIAYCFFNMRKYKEKIKMPQNLTAQIGTFDLRRRKKEEYIHNFFF